MAIFYLRDFRGSEKEVIAMTFEKALECSGWRLDDVVSYWAKAIDYFPLGRRDTDEYVRADTWCGAV